MPQQTSPFGEVKFGWNYGESGWNVGMDENLIKFSFYMQGTVDGVVSNLPAVNNGVAYYLTTDNRIYYGVNNTTYSTPVPKWYIFKLKSTGEWRQFDGSGLVTIKNTKELQQNIDTLNATIAGYGSAATKDISFFDTPSSVNTKIANSSTTNQSFASNILNTFKTQLQSNADSSGASLIGYASGVVYPQGTLGSALAMSTEEKTMWQNKAAMLDPKAYQFRTKASLGANFFEVVPAGETWFVVNMFYSRIAGNTSFYNHRVFDIDDALPITSGTRLEFHSASNGSNYYICKPSLVISTDSRYVTDPKGLYNSRMALLRTIPLSAISVEVPAGAANATVVDNPFPAGFSNAMAVGYSMSDGSWGGINTAIGAVNLGNEISDDHQNRLGHRTFAPISSTIFTGIRMRGGNVAGNTGTLIAGNAILLYANLPANW